LGPDIKDDIRRASIIREEIGDDLFLMMDCGTEMGRWASISKHEELGPFHPWWIEEPTSPDDVLGHAASAKAIAPIKSRLWRALHDRLIFKQFFKPGNIFLPARQLPSWRRPMENLAIILMPHSFKVPRLSACRRSRIVPSMFPFLLFDYVCGLPVQRK